MSLIQRNVIPIFVLLAVIGVGLAIFAASSPFASGQETESCDPGVGIIIQTTNGAGQDVALVRHGGEILYGVKLSIPEPDEGEVACNFGGGTVTFTLPSGEEQEVAVTNADTGDDWIISPGNLFSTGRDNTAGNVSYIVDQNDAVQTDPDNIQYDRIALNVSATYSGGSSYSSAGERLTGVSALASSRVWMAPPSVEIILSPSIIQDPARPDSQTVHQGQEAVFSVVINNTGGFELSGITVDSLEDVAAGEVGVADCDRASDAFEPLPVNASTVAYLCGSTTDVSFVQRAQVTANGTAQSTAGEPLAVVVSDDDTSNVFFGLVEVGITINEQSPIVRLEENGVFNITVSTPTATDLNAVTVTVKIEGPGEGEIVESSLDCYREFGTVAASIEVDPFTCSEPMFRGLNTITATIEGTVPGTATVLRATASTVVEAITPGLSIEITPGEQTIRSGDTAQLTLIITNGASSLTNVSVIDPEPNNEAVLELQSCDTPLDAVGDLAADEAISIICSTVNLSENTLYEAVVRGTASDNTTVPSDVATATVFILSPSTALDVSADEDDTVVVRLIVQTLTVTETNDGDSPLSGVKVNVEPIGKEYDINSKEFVGGDANVDGILDPGETWEWRVVTIAVAGDVVLLPAGDDRMNLSATGYGVDQLGGEVSFPSDAEEMDSIEVPITAIAAVN